MLLSSQSEQTDRELSGFAVAVLGNKNGKIHPALHDVLILRTAFIQLKQIYSVYSHTPIYLPNFGKTVKVACNYALPHTAMIYQQRFSIHHHFT
jgi:hypothetical protein